MKKVLKYNRIQAYANLKKAIIIRIPYHLLFYISLHKPQFVATPAFFVEIVKKYFVLSKYVQLNPTVLPYTIQFPSQKRANIFTFQMEADIS